MSRYTVMMTACCGYVVCVEFVLFLCSLHFLNCRVRTLVKTMCVFNYAQVSQVLYVIFVFICFCCSAVSYRIVSFYRPSRSYSQFV